MNEKGAFAAPFFEGHREGEEVFPGETKPPRRFRIRGKTLFPLFFARCRPTSKSGDAGAGNLRLRVSH